MSSNPVFVAFDVETTGLVPAVDRIVELAAIAFQGGEVLEGFSRLISPGVPMLPAASRVTGITDDLLAVAPTAADALPDFLCVLRRGTPVAHNAVFDVGFVCDELERAGLPAPECPVLDTRGLARRAFPGQFSYGLANLVRELKIIPPGVHRALADADSCRQLFQRCAGKLGSGKTPRACRADTGQRTAPGFLRACSRLPPRRAFSARPWQVRRWSTSATDPLTAR